MQQIHSNLVLKSLCRPVICFNFEMSSFAFGLIDVWPKYVYFDLRYEICILWHQKSYLNMTKCHIQAIDMKTFAIILFFCFCFFCQDAPVESAYLCGMFVIYDTAYANIRSENSQEKNTEFAKYY